MFEDHVNLRLREITTVATGFKLKSGLEMIVGKTGKKDMFGRSTHVDVELRRDPKNVHGWHRDWLDFAHDPEHLRPQVYHEVPVSLVNQLIRANGGPV